MNDHLHYEQYKYDSAERQRKAQEYQRAQERHRQYTRPSRRRR